MYNSLNRIQFRVVINASALPDPREINYDLLLSYVVSSLLELSQLINGLLDLPDGFSHISIFMVKNQGIMSTQDIHIICSVESDYTVVFLAAGGKHSPGWNWVWKAYRSLSRKYRKNLKRLASHLHSNHCHRSHIGIVYRSFNILHKEYVSTRFSG